MFTSRYVFIAIVYTSLFQIAWSTTNWIGIHLTMQVDYSLLEEVDPLWAPDKMESAAEM